MRILCAGGGTAGSVTPLSTLWSWWTHQHDGDASQLYWIHTSSPMDQRCIPTATETAQIVSSKWNRFWSIRNVLAPCTFFIAFVQAFYWCARWRPAMVWTAGSFVAVPVSFAAWVLRIPVLTIQQDIAMGLANRLIDRVASVRVSLIDPQFVIGKTPHPYQFLGTLVSLDPRSKDLLKATPKPLVLVLGGSSGAQHLNRLILKALPAIHRTAHIIHVTGTTADLEPHNDRYRALEYAKTEYWSLLQSADVVVTRAGMNAIMECSSLSKPCIVVPLPDSHQELNARLLASHHAAIVLHHSSTSADQLADHINTLLDDPQQRTRLGRNLHNLFPEASQHKLDRLRATLRTYTIS